MRCTAFCNACEHFIDGEYADATVDPLARIYFAMADDADDICAETGVPCRRSVLP